MEKLEIDSLQVDILSRETELDRTKRRRSETGGNETSFGTSA